jgi:TRAP-type C4-dicarboxylate transport system permease small subunit
MKHHVSSILKAINKLEDWFLISMLATMVVLAVTQIFYRNVFGAGIVWIDPMLRVLVLWVAIAGAVVATRTDNHIRIDFFTKYFSSKVCKCMQRLVYVFCVFICGTISWHAVNFVQMDYEFETIAFANVPAWITELVIPIGFFLMAMRYALLFISPLEQDKH